MKNDEDNHQWWFAGDKGIYYVNVGNTTTDLLRALKGVQELSDRIQFKPNKKRPKAPKLGFADSSYVPYSRQCRLRSRLGQTNTTLIFAV